MKSLFLGGSIALLALLGLSTNSNAQIQKGNLMAGANLMDLGASFGTKSSFSMDIQPKLGYFIQDNLALGVNLGVNYVTTQTKGSTYGYEVSGFTRYYFGKNEVEPLLNHGRFFAEANVGIGGDNSTPVGFKFGFGPGYSYFITPNIGLEGLVKFNGIVGSGTSTGISFGLGFQIYLPTKNARELYDDVSGRR